jgi:hypothetical protein
MAESFNPYRRWLGIRDRELNRGRLASLAILGLIWFGQAAPEVARAEKPADRRTAGAEKTDSPERERLSPPGKDAQDAAEKIVLELFRGDFDQASRGAADAKLAVAKKLMKQAAEVNDDAAARFVMYRRARDFAAAAGDVVTAMTAVDKLADQFAIDAPSERFTVLSALTKSARSPESAQATLDAALAAIDEAIEADSFELAAKFVRLASALAAKLRNSLVASQLKSRPAEIELLKKEFAKAGEARATLKSAPDDPAANLAVGLYQGPMKGDFKKSLRFLAKGSDPVLAELAKKELASPTNPLEQANLADGWWDAAEHQREPAKFHTRAHAADWYRRAGPNLKGLTKTQADSRIRQFEADRTKTPIAGRGAIVNALTSGNWHITWFKSATDYAGPLISEYPRMTFNRDGTCETDFAKGQWRFIDANSIEVTYLNYAQDYLQRFHFIGDALRCEHFNPHDKLQNSGIGARNRPE